jgi:phosphatidylglycerophosphate synthase
MLDSGMRKWMDAPLNSAAKLFPSKISANSITIVGFLIGVLSFISIMKGQFALALLFLAVNRLADGLDGAVARHHGATDLGGYLDITADFLLWALLPLGFMLHSPDTAFAAAILLSSFAMSMTVFLAFAVMAEKRGASSTAQGKKSFFYLAGLAEGTETIAFFAFVMVYPMCFTPAALIFAAIVYISVLGRLMVSVQQLKEPKNG